MDLRAKLEPVEPPTPGGGLAPFAASRDIRAGALEIQGVVDGHAPYLRLTERPADEHDD